VRRALSSGLATVVATVGDAVNASGVSETYVIVDGCLSLRNHLAVRDVLRADTVLRGEYAAIKRQAGVRAANIDEYGQAKSGMVQKILAAAGLSDGERASIAGNQVPSHDDLPR